MKYNKRLCKTTYTSIYMIVTKFVFNDYYSHIQFNFIQKTTLLSGLFPVKPLRRESEHIYLSMQCIEHLQTKKK